jgi:hypothetical protein
MIGEDVADGVSSIAHDAVVSLVPDGAAGASALEDGAAVSEGLAADDAVDTPASVDSRAGATSDGSRLDAGAAGGNAGIHEVGTVRTLDAS